MDSVTALRKPNLNDELKVKNFIVESFGQNAILGHTAPLDRYLKGSVADSVH